MPQHNGPHVCFKRNSNATNANNNNNNNNDDDDDDIGSSLRRPQSVVENHERGFGQFDDDGVVNWRDSGRRRSSSDPSGRSRQRPRLAVLRPRGNAAAAPTLAHVPEDKRIGSTAFFNAPDGRNAVNPELADVLDVIGA
ncbi:hypothetical protein RRF57_012032 [Xylaria bambusicola]|uniref:Uncharacterized protein n=1 Tax=Xylaria bambusicola TaxID=326684 RepID=A0AAN7Z474_9PEZI